MPIEELTAQFTQAESESSDPQFGLIEWILQENKITLCPYLADLFAFNTNDINQTHTEWIQLDHPEDVQTVNTLRRDLLEGKKTYILYESRKICRDGQWRWFRVRGKIKEIDPFTGKPLRAITICTEITKFKQTEQKLARMQALYSEVNKIKECNSNNTPFKNIVSEILNAFETLTESSRSYLLFSPINYAGKQKDAPPLLHTAENVDLHDLDLSTEKRDFISKLFFAENYVIQNNFATSFLGIKLDLPFKQKGLLVLERTNPFDDALADFLKPLTGTATHIISIHKLEINRSELDNMLSFFIKQVPAPVAMFDKNMRYMFISEEWNKVFGTKKSHGFIGKTHYEIFPDTPEHWRKRHQAAMRGEIQIYLEEKATHVSDKPVWVEGSMHPWYTMDGSIGGVFINSNIITERIKSAKKLQTTVKNLSRSNEALERFAHVCSHDLKEPLRSVSNFIHLLFKANAELFNEESMLYMRHILKGIDRMNILIKDILDYSKVVGQSSNERVPLDVNKVVNKVTDAFEYRFLEIGAHLNIGSLPIILCEQTQINQLFTNLISNSLKFHSEKPLVIDIFAVENDSSWEFHVRDNGIGIEKEFHNSIFTMFKRLHTKNQYEGSGIGLAICKKIMHEHHGDIYVVSPTSGGSEFIFTFPKA